MPENKNKKGDECRLTEKRMANRRFRKTEDAICKIFMRGTKKGISEAARSAGRPRSTFYYHHQSQDKILADYRRYILRKYNRLIRRISGSKADLKDMYLQLLMFILREKPVFLMFSKMGERKIFCQMVETLQPKIERVVGASNHEERVFDLYRAGMVTVLETWGSDGFLEEDMNRALTNMMTVTKEVKGEFGRRIK